MRAFLPVRAWIACIVGLSMGACTPTSPFSPDHNHQDVENPQDHNHQDVENPKSVEKLFENVERSGKIEPNERWRGTIHVIGDISIPQGRTLTIEPGTTVTFAARSDVTKSGTGNTYDPYNPHDPVVNHSDLSGIDVFGGTLVARGTPAEPIVFTSVRTKQDPADWEYADWGDWHSIHLHDPTGKIEITHSKISGSFYGIEIVGGAPADRVVIENNVFENIVACGVCFAPSDLPYSVAVKDNTFRFLGHEGIDTHKNANPVIEGNHFEDIRGWLAENPHEAGGNGIIVDESTPVIRNNVFLRNNAGIACISSTGRPIVENNHFGTDADANDQDRDCPDPISE